MQKNRKHASKLLDKLEIAKKYIYGIPVAKQPRFADWQCTGSCYNKYSPSLEMQIW